MNNSGSGEGYAVERQAVLDFPSFFRADYRGGISRLLWRWRQPTTPAHREPGNDLGALQVAQGQVLDGDTNNPNDPFVDNNTNVGQRRRS
jgi:hypothetical protein